MKIKVTEQGVTVPKEFFEGIDEVEVRREDGVILVIPSKSRISGLHPNAIQISDDFDEPLPDSFWLGNA